MADISISESVGKGGINLPPDVAKIIAALLAIGPAQGGIAAPPLTIAALGDAIKAFQARQQFAVQDGKVDRVGNTIRRINALLSPPAPQPGKAGTIRPIGTIGTLATRIDKTAWSPVPASLQSELVFKWTGVAGKGTIHYFQLDEPVVPRWFGVLVPDGTSDFSRIHLFFHPLPGQAGYDDARYHTPGAFFGIFRYLGGDRADMAVQFCAAASRRVLIMPLLTTAAAGTSGILPKRWENLFGRMLAIVKAGGGADGASSPVTISSIVVSSFSNGIAFSHAFRQRSALGDKLAGVIDFDGGISSNAELSAQITMPAGRIVRMQQMPAVAASLPLLALQGVFPLPQPRWGGPYANLFPKDPRAALLQIHGTIPQTMMCIAAQRLG